MKKYYIAESNDNQFNAANKAREDIEVLFKRNEYIKEYAYIKLLESNSPKLSLIKQLLLMLRKFKKNDYLYFQYPYYKNSKKMQLIFNVLKKYKGTKIICVIHDLDSLRYKKNKDEIVKEISFLNLCNYIISHNEFMTDWLKENGCKSNIINLKIFDYLLDDKSEDDNIRKTDIVFAGNLDKNKSGFIYKLIKEDNIGFKMNLYGPNFTGECDNRNISYCGKYTADELIKKLEGKFGLIWDGEELELCSGNMGEYTKYNNPHKLSMYVAAGLPIICWSEMAIAKFVVDNKIGRSIKSINELSEVLDDINEKEYNEMLNNLKDIRINVRNGYYITKSLSNIENIIT